LVFKIVPDSSAGAREVQLVGEGGGMGPWPATKEAPPGVLQLYPCSELFKLLLHRGALGAAAGLTQAGVNGANLGSRNTAAAAAAAAATHDV
jgi:hypothetical protein